MEIPTIENNTLNISLIMNLFFRLQAPVHHQENVTMWWVLSCAVAPKGMSWAPSREFVRTSTSVLLILGYAKTEFVLIQMEVTAISNSLKKVEVIVFEFIPTHDSFLGAFCTCHEGYILDQNTMKCIDVRQEQCYDSYNRGQCTEPRGMTITAKECCCSKGAAWGRYCEKCPPEGSRE